MSDKEETTSLDYDESGINTPEYRAEDPSFDENDDRREVVEEQLVDQADSKGSEKKEMRTRDYRKERTREREEWKDEKSKVLFLAKFSPEVQISEIKELMSTIDGFDAVYMRSKFSAHVLFKSVEAAEKAAQKFHDKPFLKSPSLVCVPSHQTKVSPP